MPLELSLGKLRLAAVDVCPRTRLFFLFFFAATSLLFSLLFFGYKTGVGPRGRAVLK